MSEYEIMPHMPMPTIFEKISDIGFYFNEDCGLIQVITKEQLRRSKTYTESLFKTADEALLHFYKDKREHYILKVQRDKEKFEKTTREFNDFESRFVGLREKYPEEYI